MQPNSYHILRWFCYAVATILLFSLQELSCQWFSVLGLYPFLYPAFAAIVACYEGTLNGSVFGLFLGILCDLLLAGPFEGFYSVMFTLSALLSAVIAERALHNRLMGCVFTATLSLLLTAFSRCLLLLGTAPSTLLFSTAAVEVLLTLPLLCLPILCYGLVQKICPLGY